ncbi:toxin VasX [Aquimarina aquimarini]|uniref:toxin VasX n=1 Tax=Aquimarina aquimarini TaxID=1191734 RepID=UPI00131ED2F7|nr:toxin VasX [Aquimarina aquimarini]
MSRTRRLILEIEAEGRTFDYSNQMLTIEGKEAPAIKLHFLRDGKLLNEPRQSHLQASMQTEATATQKDENGNILLQEVIITSPKLKHYSTVRTGINPGYVYIIDESMPDTPIEFAVDGDGNFKSISWQSGPEGFPDVRTPDGHTNTNGYYEATYGAVVWAAYSTVQWTQAYYDSLVADLQKRKDRMTQITANGFELGAVEGTDDYDPYSCITAYFSSDNKKRCSHLQRKINAIQQQEEQRAENRDTNPNHQEPEVMTDMFITLEDPIGCAIDINEGLSKKILEFKALIDAIQTGETVADAYTRMSEGCFEGPKPDKEYQALVSLAITCHQLVYNDPESIKTYDGGSPGAHLFDRYGLDPRPKNQTFYGKHTTHTLPVTSAIGYGLDYQKIEGILGVKERTALRAEVGEYKEDMGVYIKSKGLKNMLEDYLHNIAERTLDGRGLLLDILEGLMTNTYDFDRFMLVKKEYKTTDKWIDWGYELMNCKFQDQFTNTPVTSTASGYTTLDPLYALLTPLLNITEVIDKSRSISHKAAKVYKKKLKHHARQAFVVKKVGRTMFKEIPDKQNFVVAKINENLTLYGEKMFEVRDGEMRMKLHEMGVEIDTDYVQKSQHTRLKGKFNYSGTKKGNLLRRKPGFKNTKRELEILRALVGEENIENIEIVESVHRGDQQNKIKARVRKMVTSAEIEANKPNVKIAKMINGRAFNGVFAGLELINFSAAGYNLFQKGSWKSRINFVGASVKLSEALVNVIKAEKTFRGVTREALAPYTRWASRLSIVGGAFTAGMCFWESVEAMDKGDVDAGVALAFAGTAFGVSTAMSLSYFSTWALAGPVGWIAAGVGVGLLVIASLLTDSELEEFFSNFLLSDTKKFPKQAGESPMVYIQRVLDNRYALTDDDYRDTLMNPIEAEVALMDAIVCKKMEFAPIAPDRIEHETIYYGMDQFTVSEETVCYFKVTMTYLQLFSDPDQVGYRIFLYPKGIGEGNPMSLPQNVMYKQ